MPDDRIKRPAYQWYVQDARSDEVFMLMSYEQQGIYRALLDHQWLEGSLPADPVDIGRLLPTLSRTRFLRIWPLISTKFLQKTDGRWINQRLETQRDELDQFVEERRKSGQLGGRRRADNQAQLQAQLEAQPQGTRKHSSSSSSSSSSVTTVCKEHRQAPAEKAPSTTREFLGWFQGEYKARRNGATYFVRWDAHSALVKRLLTAFPVDRLKKHAQILLTTNEEWTTGTDRGIEILSAKINWLEERLCAWEAGKKAREAV